MSNNLSKEVLLVHAVGAQLAIAAPCLDTDPARAMAIAAEMLAPVRRAATRRALMRALLIIDAAEQEAA